MKSPIVLLQSLLDDVRRLDCAKGTERDLTSLSQRFENEGYGFLSIALPTLSDAIRDGFRSGKFTCPPGFKRLRGGAIPKLFSGMLCEVFDSASGQLKENANVGIVKSLFQILLLFKKIPTDEIQEKELDLKARNSFVEVDRQNVRFFPQAKADFLRCVAKSILTDLNKFDPESLDPRHGPGSVYDGETANQKWLTVSDAITQGSVETDDFGFAGYAYMVGGLDSLSSSKPEHPESQGRLNHHRHALGSVARLVTVPKSLTAVRTITVEPCWNQFIQQGLNKVLRDCISKCDVLRNSLSLTDQEPNQKLALVGSRTGECATLDLKSASDLLSDELVGLVFQNFPSFRKAMDYCRTPDCENGPYQFRMRKFAGMGNALTFPVQSIVFATLAIAARLYAKGSRPTKRNVRAASYFVRVYGDDIIVSSDVAHDVIAWLEDFGLLVNTNKSFVTGRFRESCGVDAFDGVNVTPLYFRARPDDRVWTAKTVASAVAFSNQAWMEGYYALATEVSELVEGRLGKRLPLARNTFGGLGWVTRRNAYEYTRVSRTLHRPEIKAFAIRSKSVPDVLDGYPALLKFFLSPATEDPLVKGALCLNGREKDHLKQTVKRYNSSISTRWLAA